VVLAAAMIGKIKTVTQIVAISSAFLEPVLQWIVKLIVEAVSDGTIAWRYDIMPITWVAFALSLVMTVWSGIDYIKTYWKYLDPEK
jgi:phosphatidylglycerophosphate synthase